MAAGWTISVFLTLIVTMDLATNQAAAQTMDPRETDGSGGGEVTSVTLTDVPLTFTSPNDVFSSDLLDSSSAAYQARETNIKDKLEPVYEAAYSSFSFLTVTGFSSGSVINSIVLKFDSTSVPSNSDIETTLTNAASTISGLEIDTSSISVGTSSESTVAPNTTLVMTTMTAVTTAAEDLVSRDMTWSSPNDVFTSDLEDSSSQAYQDRVTLIKDKVEPVYQNQFDNFNELNVLGFRSGSVINDVRLTFKNTSTASIPDTTDVANTFIQAAANITGLDIDTSTVTVTIPSAGAIHGISLVTASSLALLSWLLSSQQ